MTEPPSSIGARRRVALTLLGLLGLLVAACGAKPPAKPRVLNVELRAAGNVNPSTAGRPSPVVVRVYELKAAAPFEAADFVTLFDRDQSALGADIVIRDEFVLAPDESKTIRRELSPDSKFIAVMAAFRDLERARWRAVQPLASGADNTFTVRLEVSTVQLGKR